MPEGEAGPAPAWPWREATPLVVLGAAAFVAVGVLHGSPGGIGVGRLPYWVLFFGIGLIAAGGGLGVLLLSGPAPTPGEPFTDGSFVRVPSDEWDEIRARLTEQERRLAQVERPEYLEEEPGPPPAPSPRPRSAVPPLAAAPADASESFAQIVARSWPAESTAGDAPTPAAPTARRESRPTPLSAPDTATPQTPSPSPPEPARTAAVPVAALSPPSPVVTAPAPSPPAPRVPEPELILDGPACATCGRRMSARGAWRKCSNCGKALCADCLPKSIRMYGRGYCRDCAPAVPTVRGA